MKAGLITFHYAHHYGAQLQAYALNHTIEKLGIPCEIIDYVRQDTLSGSSLIKSGFSPRVLLSNAHTLLHYKRFKRRSDRFLDFYRNRLKLGSRRYHTASELAANPPSYDVLVCGSDQVWNPMIFSEKDFDPSFFMHFSGDTRRIAYAPSFGISSIPEDKKETLKAYVEGFDALSVREAQGADILRELIARPVPVVLDPTLLLNEADWSELCAPSPMDRPYILSYFITDPTPFFPVLEQIQAKLGLPVVCLCGARKKVPGTIRLVYDAGPQEFLSLFKHADFVLTNSFHGTVFSVQFRRPFYSFQKNKASSANPAEVGSRLSNILTQLGLEDRLLGADSLLQALDAIDFSQVTEKLNAKREESLNFLKEALLG